MLECLDHDPRAGLGYRLANLNLLHYASNHPPGHLVDLCCVSLRADRLQYPTQRPVALLEPIIQASSNPGDMVLDPYCGGGTTFDAAEKLGRDRVGIDVTQLAILVIRSRLRGTYGRCLKFISGSSRRESAQIEVRKPKSGKIRADSRPLLQKVGRCCRASRLTRRSALPNCSCASSANRPRRSRVKPRQAEPGRTSGVCRVVREAHDRR